jgi:WD40 repeat protein
VNAAALDALGRLAVTVSADGTGRVWDLCSGRCAHVLTGHDRSSAGASFCLRSFCWEPQQPDAEARLLRPAPVRLIHACMHKSSQ